MDHSNCHLHALAEPLLAAWDAAVRESLAVENWHSVLHPYLAVLYFTFRGVEQKYPLSNQKMVS